MAPDLFAVLLVEDDPNFVDRVCAALMLRDRSSHISVCSTAERALAQIAGAERPFDLILVDLGLPDKDGAEVIAAARRANASVPILVVSVMTSEHAVVAAIRSGANGYILKDGSDQQIADAVTDVIAGRYPLSPSLARHLFQIIAGPAPDRAVLLTERETDTLRCIGRGLSYEQAAADLGVSLSTIQSHVRTLYRKLDVHSQTQAAMKARDRGLI